VEVSAGTADGRAVVRLGTRARAWRVALLVVLAGLFLAGTAVGDDPWWPFGPWRMFATSTAPSGAVYSLSIEMRETGSADWRPAPITPSSVGLNRAEIEGRVPQLTADPRLLGTLARAHARLHPKDRAWTGVRVVQSRILLDGQRPTGEVVRTVLATWVAP